jgi:multisubunit Na+/H+ antiporter MnhB subunit
MQIKHKIKLENRMQILIALGPLAALAVVLSIFLGRMGNPDLDFITGFLIGLSIIANLVYIYVVTRHLRENRS